LLVSTPTFDVEPFLNEKMNVPAASDFTDTAGTFIEVKGCKYILKTTGLNFNPY